VLVFVNKILFLVGCESFSESPWPEIYVPEIKDVSVQTERKERVSTAQAPDIEEEEEEETQVITHYSFISSFLF
jgi:5-deoxy-D-glucuronate isomerase